MNDTRGSVIPFRVLYTLVMSELVDQRWTGAERTHCPGDYQVRHSVSIAGLQHNVRSDINSENENLAPL